MADNELWVNTRFRGQDKSDFEAVKRYLGIRTSSDVVRFLVRKQFREIEQARLLIDIPETYDVKPEPKEA